MSNIQHAKVWRLALKRPLKSVLFALADIGDDFGRNIYASEEYVAWKTDYDVRQIRRIYRELKEKGILIMVKAARGRAPAHYRIDLAKAPQKPPFKKAGKPADFDTDSGDTEADKTPESQTVEGAQDDSLRPVKMSGEAPDNADIAAKSLDESEQTGQNVRAPEDDRTFEAARPDILEQRPDISGTEPPASDSSETASGASYSLNDQCLDDQDLNEAPPASPAPPFSAPVPVSEEFIKDATAAPMTPVDDLLTGMMEAPPAHLFAETVASLEDVKKKKTLGRNDPLFPILAALCFRADTPQKMKLLTEGQRFQIVNTIKAFRAAEVDTEAIDRFDEFWRTAWQSGMKNKPPSYQPPAPVQVRELWPQFIEWLVVNSAKPQPETRAEAKAETRDFVTGDCVKWRGQFFVVLYNHGTYGTVEGLIDKRIIISVFRWQQSDPVELATEGEVAEILEAENDRLAMLNDL